MSDNTIFHEVEEELRSERMRNFWRRFGPYVIGGAIAIVLIVAVNEGWSWWQATNAARSSDAFYSAVDLAQKGDVDGAKAALAELEKTGSGSYPDLARFQTAALEAKNGDVDAALADYDALATSVSNNRLRDVALLLGAYLLVDKGDVDGVKSRVLGLIAADNPMRNSAREALGLAQYAAGDIDAARKTFTEILGDPGESYQSASRVQIYVAQLVAEGAADPNPPAASAGNDDSAAAGDAAAAPAENGGQMAAPAMNADGEATGGAAATDSPAQ